MEDNFLNITGSALINETLDNDQAYLLTAEITTFSTGEKRSLQNGEYTLHHKAKISGNVILQKGDKVITGRVKTSKASQKLRFELEARADAKGVDREQYYQNTISKLIDRIDEVDIFLNK